MRQIAIVFLVIGIAAMGLLLFDWTRPARAPDELIVADMGDGRTNIDGSYSDTPRGRYSLDAPASSLPVGILEGIGSVVVVPLAEFLDVEPTASASRWVGAASPFAMGLLCWIVPSPFRRKTKA